MKKLSLLLTALCCAASMFAATITTEIGGINYKLDDVAMTAVVTKKTPAYTGEVTIPSQVTYSGDTYTVTTIGQSSFSSCTVTAVSIPETVTAINDYAFNNCTSLVDVNIPSGLTFLGAYAFRGVKLTSVTIPNTLTEIGYCAFYQCTTIESLTIPEGVQTIGSYSFYEVTGMNNKDLVLPSTITSIGNYAFSGIYLNSVTCLAMTPPNLATWSFASTIKTYCKLYVPVDAYDDYVNHAEWGQFTNMPVTINGITYNHLSPNEVAVVFGPYTGDITIPETVTIGNTTYTVSAIGDGAFLNNVVTSVHLPNTIRTIEQYAFANCTHLTYINLPEGLTSIGYYGLNGCSGLTALTLPSTLQTLGEKALYNLTSLLYIKCLPTTPPTTVFGDNCFSDANLSLPFYVPDESIGDYTHAQNIFGVFHHLPLSTFALNGLKIGNFYYNMVGAEATLIPTLGSAYSTCAIPNSVVVDGETYTVTAIADEAFMNSTVNNYSLPANLKTIGARAFKKCYMPQLTLPATVTSIGQDAFADCYYLNTISVEAGNTHYDSRDGSSALIETATNKLLRASKATTTIPASVTAIAGSAFSYMNGLTSVTIPDGVATIGDSCFYECRNLRTITLPSTLTSLGAAALKTCISVNSITVTAPVPPTCGSNCFQSVPTSATLTVPHGKTAVYRAAAGWSAFTNVVEIPLPTYAVNFGTRIFCTITSPTQNARFTEGEEVTVAVTPDQGYRVTSVSVVRADNSAAVTLTNNKFIMPASDVTISATASNIYTITVDNAEHGTVSVSSTSIAEGNNVYITATPSAGYELDHYVVDGVNQEASVFVMPAKDIHVTAVFRLIQYSAHILGTYFCTASCSPETASAGTVITVSYTPDTNYSLDSIVVRRQDNNALIAVSNGQFTMPEAHVGIRVYCSANKFTISKSETAHGTFDVATNAAMGAVVTITATPAEGYTIDHYTVDGVVQAANTFTMPAHNVTVGVVFRALTYNVTLYATHCSITYTPATSTIATDTEVTVTVTPETGYHFSSLEVKAGTTPIAVTNNKFTMPAAAIGIYAVCEEDLYTVTAAPTEHGSFTLSHTTNVAKGTTVTITATPDEEYEVDHYVVDGGEQAANTFVMPNHDVTVGVVFVQKTYAATLVNHSGCEASLSATNAAAGAEISISITPSEGLQIDSIIVRRVDNGEKVAVSNDNKFTMPSAAVEVSIYGSAIKYHVTVETAENCSVVLSDEEAVMGAQVSLTITPASGNCTLNSIEVERTDTHELLTVTDYSFFMPASDVVVRVIYDDTTGLENLNGDKMATKILRDGQVLIQRGDRIYDLRGQEVK